MSLQERPGAWRALAIPPTEVFVWRSRDGRLQIGNAPSPGVGVGLRSTEGGIEVTRASAGVLVNGKQIAGPVVLKKFDLLELAGAFLRSDDGLSASEATEPDSPAPVPVRATPAPEGQRLGNRYVLEKELGQGGFGVVYRAHDTQLDRPVAIKVLLRADERALKRFVLEIRATAALRHPNLVTVYDSGIDGDRPYLVMELVEGTPLDRLAEAEGSLGPTQAAAILRDVAKALAYAHQRGLLHRDLKPQNVLVRPDGQAVLLDFGLVRVLGKEDAQTRITRSGMRLGTLPYMSPEQAFSGDQDERSEVYGLGATLYHTLARTYPFAGDSDMTIAIASRDPIRPSKLRPGVPPDLEAICLKSMEKRARDRYPTAAAFAEDLTRFLDGEPTLARPVGPLVRQWKRLRRSRLAQISAASTAAILAVTLTAAGLLQSKGTALAEAEQELADQKQADREAEVAVEAQQAEATAVAQQRTLALERRLEEIADGPQGVDPELAALEFVRAGPLAIPILCDFLAELSADLLAVERSTLLEANQLREGEEHIAGLEESVEAFVTRKLMDRPLPPDQQRALLLAEVRLRARSRSIDPGSVALQARVLVARHQQEAIRAGRFVAGDVACHALGELAGQEAREALAMRIRAEASPLRALPAGQALIRHGPVAFPALLAAYDRFGLDTVFARRLGPSMKTLVSGLPKETSSAADHMTRARFHLLVGDQALALREVDQALVADPDLMDGYLIRARARANTGDLPGALADMDRALELSPQNGELLSNRSYIKLLQGDLEGAYADAQGAVRLDPSSANSHFNAGQILLRMGKPSESLAALNEGVRLDPNFAAAWALRASIRDVLGDKPGAEADAREALRLDPSDAVGNAVLASAYLNRKENERAEGYYSKALAGDPKTGYFIGRATARTRLGDRDGALRDLDDAVAAAPPQLLDRALFSRGVTRLRFGRFEEAVEDLRRVVDHDPANLNALHLTARFQLMIGRFDDALVYARLLVQRDPKNASSWAVFAGARYQTGDAQGGHEAVAQALAVNPRSGLALLMRGAEHARRGRLQEALSDLDRAVELTPQSGEAWEQRGRVRLQLGDIPAGLADLESSLRIAPLAPQAAELRKLVAALKDQAAPVSPHRE